MWTGLIYYTSSFLAFILQFLWFHIILNIIVYYQLSEINLKYGIVIKYPVEATKWHGTMVIGDFTLTPNILNRVCQ